MYSSWYNPNKKNPIRSAKAIPKRNGTEIMNTIVSGSAGVGQMRMRISFQFSSLHHNVKPTRRGL